MASSGAHMERLHALENIENDISSALKTACNIYHFSFLSFFHPYMPYGVIVVQIYVSYLLLATWKFGICQLSMQMLNFEL